MHPICQGRDLGRRTFHRLATASNDQLGSGKWSAGPTGVVLVQPGFGNLYHLNAEQEPEHPDYPKDPEFKKKFGPRGVIHSYADGRIEDTGPLTIKRMETLDEEVTAAALDFMDRAHKANKPFFIWWNSTRMHIWTHLKPESKGKTGCLARSGSSSA